MPSTGSWSMLPGLRGLPAFLASAIRPRGEAPPARTPACRPLQAGALRETADARSRTARMVRPPRRARQFFSSGATGKSSAQHAPDSLSPSLVQSLRQHRSSAKTRPKPPRACASLSLASNDSRLPQVWFFPGALLPHSASFHNPVRRLPATRLLAGSGPVSPGTLAPESGGWAGAEFDFTGFTGKDFLE